MGANERENDGDCECNNGDGAPGTYICYRLTPPKNAPQSAAYAAPSDVPRDKSLATFPAPIARARLECSHSRTSMPTECAPTYRLRLRSYERKWDRRRARAARRTAQ